LVKEIETATINEEEETPLERIRKVASKLEQVMDKLGLVYDEKGRMGFEKEGAWKNSSLPPIL